MRLRTMGVCAFLGLLLFCLTSTTAYGTKKIAGSSPDYGYVEVQPYQTFSGAFTVFNTGDEEFLAYAEYRGAPGTVQIAWRDPNVTPEEWHEGVEILIPAGEHRYGRFIITLGALEQGRFYNWTITLGYIEPTAFVVPGIGIRIHMIYPFPPPLPPPWYRTVRWDLLGFLGILSGCTGYIIYRGITGLRNIQRKPVWQSSYDKKNL